MLARVDVDPLEREQQRIESRRQRFQERTARILDPKQRTLGIDTKALQQQVEERRLREMAERQAEEAAGEMMNKHAAMVSELERQRREEARRREAELAAFREQQAIEARRRLAEMNKVGNAIDPLEAENSVVLRFSGEDLDHDTRVKAQQLQLQDWLGHQLRDKREREQKEQEQDARFEAQQRAIQLELVRLHAAKEAQEKKDRQQLQQMQLTQAEEARIRRQYEKERDLRMAQAEVEAQMNSALLNELSQARVDNAARPIPAAFKGFTTNQREAILYERERQLAEHAARKEAEAREEQAWAEKMAQDRKTLLMRQMEAANNRAKELQALAETRRQQAVEQGANEHQRNKVTYQNRVTEEFFGQFQTSCR